MFICRPLKLNMEPDTWGPPRSHPPRTTRSGSTGFQVKLGGDFRMFLGPQLGGLQLFAETAALRALLTVRFSAPNFECDRVQLKRI